MAIVDSLAFCIILLPLLAVAALSPRQEGPDEAIVYERFHIQSTIVARYAITSITSVALNSAGVSKELSFQVQLPETAFISNFTMIVNGSIFVGLADEKASAEREFERRQQAGENVGLVESRGTNLFRIRINTAAQSRATFVLEYEELLDRRLSMYEQTINLNPGSVITDFRATVRAIDEQGIGSYTASDFVTATRVSNQEVTYKYTPSVSEQNDQTFGLARDMVVAYDVVHMASGPGLIVVNNCYFAQFFSPSGIAPIPVDIVFVIDVSGSMGGTKIQQARDSLVAVISQLRDADRFSIVTFSTSVSVWRSELVSVASFRESGITFARGLVAGGGTNFTGGMQRGISILKQSRNTEFIQLLVMLTDGQPTVGVTDEDQIVLIASRELVGTTISLNTLGFGVNLNFQLLVRLALENRGIAQRIYEGTDAADQLEGFYREISSPILRGITVTYPPNAIDFLSEQDFPLLFAGSEIVVAGKFVDSLCESSIPIPVSVSSTGASEQRLFEGEVVPADETEIAGFQPSAERLLAYLTIQQTLDKLAITENAAESARLNASALNMALRYNFVTPLTSLIVVQTNVTSADNSTDTTDEDGEGGPEDESAVDAVGPGFVVPTGGGGGGYVQGLSESSLSSKSSSVVALAISLPLAFIFLLCICTAAIVTATTLYYVRRRRSVRLNASENKDQMMCPLTEDTDGRGDGRLTLSKEETSPSAEKQDGNVNGGPSRSGEEVMETFEAETTITHPSGGEMETISVPSPSTGSKDGGHVAEVSDKEEIAATAPQ